MEATKEELKNAIMYFAKKYNLEHSYKAIFEHDNNLPKIVEMIVYELFLKQFNVKFCDSAEGIKNYKLILRYAIELKEKGFVEFK